MRLLLETNVLLEPLRECPDAAVMATLERGDHTLHTVSVVIHDLGHGIERLPAGRWRERLRRDRQGLLESGLTLLPDSKAALWHGQQRARLEDRGLRPAVADG